MKAKLNHRQTIWTIAAGMFVLTLILTGAQDAQAQAQWTGPDGSNKIYYNSGNVGIGTTSPDVKLEVNGDFKVTGILDMPSSSYFRGNFSVGYRFNNAADDKNLMRILDNGNVLIEHGNVGIGTSSPGNRFHLFSNEATAAPLLKVQQANSGGYSVLNLDRASNPRVVATSYSTGGTDEWYTGQLYNGGSPSTKFSIATGNALSESKLTIQADGKVGIGTTSPDYKLDVSGDTRVSGDINLTGTIHARYQDVAEWVPSSEQLPAGTVVVLDSTKSNQVISSSVGYDTRVAGVISAQPGIALGEKGDNKVLVATTGRVRVKVDASKSPIHIGDLLVTSDIPGVAMKSEAVEIGGRKMHMPGTLIGKALEPLEKGKGEILVLLSLQ